jgi:D-alanyl-D-alanine carboxypeptidase
VRDTTYTTSNQLLPGQPQAYDGAYGVKTGTTDMARENLVSAAKSSLSPSPTNTTDVAPNAAARMADWGPDVVAVVLGSDNDAATTADRFTDSRTVLDFGLRRT